MNTRVKLAKRLLTIAKCLIADSNYIYDPEHKKHPGGGYHKTENGWSKREKREKKPSNQSAPRTYADEKTKSLHKQFKQDYGKNYQSDSDWASTLSNPKMHPNDLHQFAKEVCDSSIDIADLSESANAIVNNPNTSDETLKMISNNAESFRKQGYGDIADKASKTLSDRKSNGIKKSLKDAPLLR